MHTTISIFGLQDGKNSLLNKKQNTEKLQKSGKMNTMQNILDSEQGSNNHKYINVI